MCAHMHMLVGINSLLTRTELLKCRKNLLHSLALSIVLGTSYILKKYLLKEYIQLCYQHCSRHVEMYYSNDFVK